MRMSRRNAQCVYVFIIQLELKSHLFSVTNCSINISCNGEGGGRRDRRREGSPFGVRDLARAERARQNREKQKKAAKKR